LQLGLDLGGGEVDGQLAVSGKVCELSQKVHVLASVYDGGEAARGVFAHAVSKEVAGVEWEVFLAITEAEVVEADGEDVVVGGRVFSEAEGKEGVLAVPRT
jgi:hypothetical protein